MFVLKVTVDKLVEHAIGFYTSYEWKDFPPDHYPVVLSDQQYKVVCTPEQLELCEFLAPAQSTIYVLSKKVINQLSNRRFTTYLNKEAKRSCDMVIPETLIDSALKKLNGTIDLLIDLKDKYGTCNVERVGQVFPPIQIKMFTRAFRIFLITQPETRNWTEFQINHCWDMVLEKTVETAKGRNSLIDNCNDGRENYTMADFIRNIFTSMAMSERDRNTGP